MNRDDVWQYVSYALDDSMNVRQVSEAPESAKLVCWQCGFEPLCVAVWSYIPEVNLDAQDAEEIASEHLEEIGWFGGVPYPADYVI